MALFGGVLLAATGLGFLARGASVPVASTGWRKPFTPLDGTRPNGARTPRRRCRFAGLARPLSERLA